MRLDPSFDPSDSATWPITLTVDQVSAIYQRSPNGLRKACQFHRFIPAPFKERPYLWRRIDVERDVIGARGTVSSFKKASGW